MASIRRQPSTKTTAANVHQGGRFASASQNLSNKGNTARLQGEETFEVIDAAGNRVTYDTAQYQEYQKQQKIQQQQKATQQRIENEQALARKRRNETTQKPGNKRSVSLNENLSFSDMAKKRKTISVDLRENLSFSEQPPTTVNIQPKTTVQKSTLKVNPIRYYEQDTRPIEEQIKNPVPANPVFGPYIQTQSDVDVIVRNRQEMKDDYDRSQLRTLSDNAIVKNIQILQKPAKAFDEYFETNKLPKERSYDNQLRTGFVAPVSNIIADIDDLGKATSKYIKSGGKEGFVKGKGPLGQYFYEAPKVNPKIETYSGLALSGQPTDINNPIQRGSIYGDVLLLESAAVEGLAGSPKPKPESFVKESSVRPFPKATLKLGPETKTPFTKLFPKTTLNQALKSPTRSGRVTFGFPKATLKLGPAKKTPFVRPFPKSNLKLGPAKKPNGKSNPFDGSEFKLGSGIGFVIPKGQAKPPVPPKQKGFDIIGMNEKGGTVSKPFFEEPKKSSKGNQILKEKDEVRQVLQGKYQQEQETRQSNTLDNLFKKPTKKKSSSASEFEQRYEYDIRNKPASKKPGIMESITPKTAGIVLVGTGIKPQTTQKNKAIGILKTVAPQKQKSNPKNEYAFFPKLGQKQTPTQTPEFIYDVPTKTTPTFDTPPYVPTPTLTPPKNPPLEPTPRLFPFPPYVPGAYFGSGGFENPSSLKKGFAAYGISSDINIKTLPTYSRYGQGSYVFKAQAKEDEMIQNLFYGKTRKSKSNSKKKSTKKKKKK